MRFSSGLKRVKAAGVSTRVARESLQAAITSEGA